MVCLALSTLHAPAGHEISFPSPQALPACAVGHPLRSTAITWDQATVERPRGERAMRGLIRAFFLHQEAEHKLKPLSLGLCSRGVCAQPCTVLVVTCLADLISWLDFGPAISGLPDDQWTVADPGYCHQTCSALLGLHLVGEDTILFCAPWFLFASP